MEMTAIRLQGQAGYTEEQGVELINGTVAEANLEIRDDLDDDGESDEESDDDDKGEDEGLFMAYRPVP